MTPSPFPRYVDEHEAVKITGFKVQTLRNWRFEGKGPPYVKCGRAVRYRVDELVAFMEKGRVERT